MIIHDNILVQFSLEYYHRFKFIKMKRSKNQILKENIKLLGPYNAVRNFNYI